METIVCPACGRTVNVRANKFGDKTYARHKLKTMRQVEDDLWRNKDANREEARQEILNAWAANPLAYSETEIDCPNSGQPL